MRRYASQLNTMTDKHTIIKNTTIAAVSWLGSWGMSLGVSIAGGEIFEHVFKIGAVDKHPVAWEGRTMLVIREFDLPIVRACRWGFGVRAGA